MAKFASVDDYIESFPADVQTILEEIRSSIRRAVPGTVETIKYQMPTITLNGKSLVHFAAWKEHIGLYPLPGADQELRQDLVPYNTGKGTASFPLSEPIPYELIGRIAAALAAQRDESP